MINDDGAVCNRLWAALIIEELVRNNVVAFYLSPGSRCSPLTIAVAEHPRAHSVVHLDERGAAYSALGYGKATGRPAAVLCSSGTAVANYLPAVVEASYAHIPLIVVTADRPPELQDTAANQAIDQADIFGRFVRIHVTVPCPDKAIAPETVLTTIDQAVYRACNAPAGPVHINCRIREPLLPHPDIIPDFSTEKSLQYWAKSTSPYTYYAPACRNMSHEMLSRLLDGIHSAQHGLVVVGSLHDPEDIRAVAHLTEHLHWPVLPDITSGLRLGAGAGSVVHYYDLMLTSNDVKPKFQADTILHIGGRITSKRLLTHLEVSQPERYFLIADHPMRQDPVHRVTHRVEASVAAGAEALAGAVTAKTETAWLADLLRISRQIDQRLETDFEKRTAISEVGVARFISAHIPETHLLFLGNSMPIRDMDTFAGTGGAPVRVMANRGASGIDGNIATAAGLAGGSQQPVTAILGDLAALHDLNSLALLKKIKAPVLTIIINNNGGGIFSFLPVAEYSQHFEEYFGTPHQVRFEHAAGLFGLPYAAPGTMKELDDVYTRFLKKGQSAIIEIITDRAENLRHHQELFTRSFCGKTG